MNHLALAGPLLLGCALLLPCDVEAQRQRAVSFDANIGWGSSNTSGQYKGSGKAPTIEALLALSLRNAGSGGLVTGLSVALEGGNWVTNDMCVQLPTGECMPEHPGFTTLGGLVGWENASATLRAMAGPVYAREYGEEGGALGFKGRFDGALPVFSHFSLVASVRGTVIPSYRGDSFRIATFGLGARIH